MKYIIKEVNYNDVDFKKLCAELDEFQNKIIPWRIELGVSGLSGLEKLQKVLLMYDGDKVIASAALKPIDETTAEIANVQILFIEKPGVKNAVMANTTAEATNLPTICHTIEVVY